MTNNHPLSHRAPQNGLVWFDQDLRVNDNPALHQAAQECANLIYVYCVDPDWWQPLHWQCRRIAPPRERFLREGLTDLNEQLQIRGAGLLLVEGRPADVLKHLIKQYAVSRLYANISGSVYQQQTLNALEHAQPEITVVACEGDTLWREAELPFPLEQLPASFTPFRKQIEDQHLRPPLSAPKTLPPALCVGQAETALKRGERLQRSGFCGGTQAGKEHLDWYFAGGLPKHYKQTRNALDGWDQSTKFSPWLAQGAISARQVVSKLREYEAENGANESTYWIYFELLWREYFKWYARRYGARLFRFTGTGKRKPLTSFYPERFKAWSQGNTPYPIVNACMRQLNETGYMSNRGRQLCASCLIYEYQIDWRYGAAYFEQQLIDYDVTANWGNWQYIAGVGADPRGGRHFNLDKQTAVYDPEQRFIQRWQGHRNTAAMDSRDAADWPIEAPK
ncbi:MAG: DASH family cryptochrome [Oleiphilaceae bacterium]|nr:DASH family cryptochrome [Oleiphilaceae bacterium]